ncbi:DndE family protein [Mucilaginibacter aquaedulcis]|uniref:DndE family protein n=1 Tax=Mucilaginibacter aquaedulcis TaxID=1187081 RepID=UPI0025B3EB2C|nr:DndE family protein [Mucilaginibacter aquaedulcis]MDN3548927.1 DndE family protein [Mucilaginibacter aquaedulcis]
MFSTIRTSKANKELVTQLTNKFNLGAENVIARLAFSFSLSTEQKLNLSQIQDSGGKEYNSKVLFGDYADIYMALLCVHYNLYKSDKDLPKYVKLHIDNGLELISKEIENKDSITGEDFIINQIEKGLSIFEK